MAEILNQLFNLDRGYHMLDSSNEHVLITQNWKIKITGCWIDIWNCFSTKKNIFQVSTLLKVSIPACIHRFWLHAPPTGNSQSLRKSYESHVTKQDILMLMPLQYVWLNSQLQNNNNSLHSLYFSLRTPLLAPCSSAGKLQSLWKCLGVRGLLLLTRANDKKKRICADLLTYFFSTEPSCFTAPWWQFKPRSFDRTNKAVGPGRNPKLINIYSGV